MGTILKNLLLDPAYWRPRLQRLEAEPADPVVCPRPDLRRREGEVEELCLRAHDGAALRAFLARPRRPRAKLRLHPVEALEAEAIDELALERGEADVIFAHSAGRRLEDRILDTLRVACAAAGRFGVAVSGVRFVQDPGRPGGDEVAIAELLCRRGWVRDARGTHAPAGPTRTGGN